MKTEFKNPCKECICLPTCISIYKSISGNASLIFRNGKHRCELVCKNIPYGGNYETMKIFNYFNEWWKDNYGKQT